MRSLNMGVIALFLLSTVVVTTLATCPASVKGTNASSYQAFGNDCYYFTAEHKDRFDAELVCLDADGYLTSVHSAAENEFIRKKLADTYNVNRRVYIGMEKVFDDFHWLDHSSVDFTNFDANSTETYSQFADDVLICTSLDPKTGFWYPYRCNWGSDPLPFVCKFKDANKTDD